MLLKMMDYLFDMNYKGKKYKLTESKSNDVCRLCDLEKECYKHGNESGKLYRFIQDGCLKFGNENKNYKEVKK